MSMYRSHIGILLTALMALAASNCLLAESRGITAVLSSSEAVVGQTVQLQIHVTGFRGAETPEKIDVDGLQIYRTGTEQHFEVINGAASASVIYDYTILPGKPGTFKIPPQTVRAGGNSYSTPELTLHVVGSATRQAGPNQGSTSKINPG